MSLTGQVLRNRWKVGSKLGEGGCATVYEAEDLRQQSNFKLVVKCAPLATGNKKSAVYKAVLNACNTIYYEYTLYNALLADFKHRPSHPDTDYYGEDKGVRYLVIQRLQEDLTHLATRTAFTRSWLAGLGLQMLEGMEVLHNKGIRKCPESLTMMHSLFPRHAGEGCQA